MKRTILWLSVLLAMAGTAPASAAFLGVNPRLGESSLNTGIEQVAGDVSREGLTGSGGAWLRRASEFFVAPATVQRTNAQLVQDIATRADAWGTRQGLGNGSVAGTLEHGYADRVLTRYQQMFGDRGLSTEVRYINGAPWQQGLIHSRGRSVSMWSKAP